LTVDLYTFLSASATDSIAWNLSKIKLQNDPNFTYNIYSNTMEDFIFSKDMNPNEKITVNVPDGELTLFLYQTAEMSAATDPQQIYEQVGVLSSTMPPRSVTTDFAYGDPREIIATSAVVMDAINGYCWSGAGAPDPKCLSTPAQDTLLRVLGSYGMAGTLSVSDGMRGRETLVSLSFCSAVPNRTAGLRDPANKAHMQSSSTRCTARRRALGADIAASARACHPKDPPAAPPRRLLGGAGPGCFGRFDPVTGAVDCQAPQDVGCPEYWYQVCSLGLPPYMAMQVPCSNHSDCRAALAAPLCATGGLCVPCQFCQVDADDTADGRCPQDTCPGTGGWPQCVDGRALVRRATPASCPARISFGVWKYHDPGTPVNVLRPVATALSSGRRSASRGVGGASGGEGVGSGGGGFVTSSNVLLGPVALTQRRRRTGPCPNRTQASLGAFFSRAECRLDVADGRPYGRDPVFLPSSAIYNGKLEVSDYFEASEVVAAAAATVAGVNVTTRAAPLGFFPHKHKRNASLLRAGDADLFRLYFDDRITIEKVRPPPTVEANPALCPEARGRLTGLV
jgi:hypothetical protein